MTAVPSDRILPPPGTAPVRVKRNLPCKALAAGSKRLAVPLVLAVVLAFAPLTARHSVAQEAGPIGGPDAELRVSVVVAGPAAAPAGSGLDRRLLYAVYESDGALVRTTLRAFDATSMPVAAGAVPLAFLHAYLGDDPGARTDAIRLGLSELAATAVVIGGKVVFARPRPFTVEPGIVSRSGGHDARLQEAVARDAFPSGHTALAFALATSWTRSHPHWYVGVPAFTWAAGVSMSRVWLGVHYPSDVAAGAAVGVLAALVVHRIVPDRSSRRGERVSATASPIGLRITF